MSARFFPLASAGLFELANSFHPLAGGGGMDAGHLRRVLATLLPLAAQARLVELLDGAEEVATRRLYALAGLFERAQATGGAALTREDVALLRATIEECAHRLSELELRQERAARLAAIAPREMVALLASSTALPAPWGRP